MYKASSVDCSSCSLKSRCTLAPRRGLARHLYEDALNWMEQQAMRLRRCTVEHPFATIKYRIFGHRSLLMRGLTGLVGVGWSNFGQMEHSKSATGHI